MFPPRTPFFSTGLGSTLREASRPAKPASGPVAATVSLERQTEPSYSERKR
jgi:hypothetical protein